MQRGRKHATVRQGGTDPQALFRRAVADYEAGRYRQARKALAPLLQGPDPDGFVTLLAGLVDAALSDWRSAAKRLEAAVQLLPARVEAWMGLGNTRLALGDPEAAVEAYRHAVDLQPSGAEAWNNLALAYGELRRHHDALSCYEHALTAAPGFDSARRGRADSLARTGRFEAADAAYAELVESDPDDVVLALDYAELLEKANRDERARAVLPESASLRGPALIARREALRARLLARGGELEEALEVVRSAYRKTREEWLGYTEGTLLDRMEEPGRAIEAFRRANRARARTRTARRLREQAVPGYLDHKIGRGIEPCGSSGSAGEGRTPVFIIGLPRSGTTLLDRMLAAHPDIQVLEEPESLRVAEAVTASGGDPAEARRRYWAYLEETAGLDADRLVVDKNPMHALHLDLLPSLFPEATVVFSLRHPFDSALSCFMQDFALNPATVHFLELESTAQLCVRLLRMMQLYEQACAGNVLRIQYEDLVTDDHRRQLAPVLERMDLSWHADMDHYAEKASQSGLIKSASYEQVTRGIYQSAVERWRGYEQWLEPFREVLGPELSYWGYGEE